MQAVTPGGTENVTQGLSMLWPHQGLSDPQGYGQSHAS